MNEKPLHLRVAEALGWAEAEITPETTARWRAIRPGRDYFEEVPHYDTDWSAAGPVIERYRISLEASNPPDTDECLWTATSPVGLFIMRRTPLMAACVLIVEMHESGAWEVTTEVTGVSVKTRKTR